MENSSQLELTQLTALFSTQTDPIDPIEEHPPPSSAWGKLVGSRTICTDAPSPDQTSVISYTVDLEQPIVTIGRHRDADVRFTEFRISNWHFRVFLDGSVPYIEDLSSNGTFLNGSRLELGQPVPLKNQDHIVLIAGSVFFLFSDLKNRTCDDLQGQIKDRYYLLDRVLGEGTFGVVKLAVKKDTGQRIACKIITKSKIAHAKRHIENLNREVSILRHFDHPNIVRMHEVYESDEYVYLMLELVQGGDLYTQILNRGRIPETEARFTFYQLLLGIQYLHRNNITHRDLKPENILIYPGKEFNRIAIADFGLAKVKTYQDLLKTRCGTPFYMAPEVLNPEVPYYGSSIDLWSLGCVLYVMLSGQEPFPDESEELVNRYIMSGLYDFESDVWDGISIEAMDIICKLLEVNPKKRLTVKEALEHPWIHSRERSLAQLYEQNVVAKWEAEKRRRANDQFLATEEDIVESQDKLAERKRSNESGTESSEVDCTNVKRVKFEQTRTW